MEDLKSVPNNSLYTTGTIFQETEEEKYRYNGTKGTGIPQKRANKNLHFAETMKYTQVHSLYARFLEDGALLPPRSFISPLYYSLVFCSQTLYAIDRYLRSWNIHESSEIAVFPMSTMDSV